MTRHIGLVSIALAVLAPAATLAAPVTTARPRDEASDAAELIEALRLSEAEAVLARASEKSPDAPDLLFQRSLLDFHRGAYESAVELSARAIEASSEVGARAYRGLHALQRATLALTRSYVHVTSDDQRFDLAFQEGPDRVLLPHAFAALRAMDAALQAVFGVAVPGPIRVEIYGSADDLAAVSTLTKEQIETSGTVALCKWNRLMITSPRALVRGYPWADTLAHELTHLYVSYVTREKAPVWLQEGTAKLLEHRFRGNTPFALDPASRALLQKATTQNELLTFERLHPSIALLPSQDDAALAFAQVATFMSHYVGTHGEGALRDAFARIASGADAREALASAASTRFAALERAWRSMLPRGATSAAPRALALRFRRGSDRAPDESVDVAEGRARRFLRLGDLLWTRRHTRAAMLEYEKGQQADTTDPIIAARLARAALAAGDPTRALAAVDPLRERYPAHAPTHAVRGAALFSLGRRDEARAELLDAVRINPFDPEPHCLLHQIDTSDTDAKSACASLRAP